MIDFVIADPVDGKQVDTSLEKPIEKDHIQSLKGVEEGDDILLDMKICGAEVLRLVRSYIYGNAKLNVLDITNL